MTTGETTPWCDSCGQKIPFEGHDKPCYYCGQPCDGLAGNPNKWPIPLTHRDEPGVVKWHHIGCVSRRLFENIWTDDGSLETLYQDAMKWREYQASLKLEDQPAVPAPPVQPE